RAWLWWGGHMQARAKRLVRFVDGEAGLVGGDLEEYAARLARIDGAEVLALDHRCHCPAGSDQRFPPGPLVGVVECPPGDVVHRARGLLALLGLRVYDEV